MGKILGGKATKKIIRDLLIKHPHLRDDDNKLLANVWFQTVIPLEEAWMDFLAIVAKGDIPSPKAISRCRRKLQEMHPSLRGEQWYKRHKMQEQVVIELQEMQND